MGDVPASAAVDPVTITLIGGMVVTIITTLVSGIVTVITALRVTAVKEQQATAAVKIETVAKDTEAIKGHVNSEKTASEGRETTLRKENELLREMIADKKATAGLLAQAVAVRAAEPAKVEPTPVEVVNQPPILVDVVKKDG